MAAPLKHWHVLSGESMAAAAAHRTQEDPLKALLGSVCRTWQSMYVSEAYSYVPVLSARHLPYNLPVLLPNALLPLLLLLARPTWTGLQAAPVCCTSCQTRWRSCSCCVGCMALWMVPQALQQSLLARMLALEGQQSCQRSGRHVCCSGRLDLTTLMNWHASHCA